jgi:hypothetical protein
MLRAIPIFPSLCLVLLVSCHGPVEESRETSRRSETIEITAVELHKAYAADANAAEKRFEGQSLLVTGEVKNATPMFLGRTMSGEVTVPAKVYFKTEVDYLPHDIKYVVCEGDFADIANRNFFALNPKIKVGETLTVRCDPAKIRWTDPGLYLSNCSLVSP